MQTSILCIRRYLRATIFSFLLLSCGYHKPVALNSSNPNLSAKDYSDVLEKWTRSDRVYQMLDTKIFVDATFHSPEFRQAFAVAFPNIYGHGGIITKRELVELTENVEQYHTFFLKVYTANTRWNDLAKTDSIWHVTLSRNDGSATMDPVEILAVKIDANLQAVYPYLNRFDKAYLVRFPLADPLQRLLISEDAQGFTLKIASALGEAKLVWKLLPPAQVLPPPEATPAAETEAKPEVKTEPETEPETEAPLQK